MSQALVQPQETELMRQQARVKAARANMYSAAKRYKAKLQEVRQSAQKQAFLKKMQSNRSKPVFRGIQANQHIYDYNIINRINHIDNDNLQKEAINSYYIHPVYSLNDINISNLQKHKSIKRKKMMSVLAVEILEKYNLSLEILKSPTRHRSAVWPRQEFCYEAVKAGHWSTPQIGRFLNRDHTTILHAVNSHCYANKLKHPVSNLFITKCETTGKFLAVESLNDQRVKEAV